MSQVSYRKLFTIPGAIAFSAAAFLGRLPAGMIGLSIILPLSMQSGSYALAGVIAACTMIGMAVSAPFSGRLVDRYGQSAILFIFAVLNFIWMSALIACIQFDVPLLILGAVAVLAGASRLSTGTLARVRWAYVTRTIQGKQREVTLQAAYAFEALVDELVFISAPILATLLCTAVHPYAGLVCCLLSFVIGAATLAVQRATEPPIEAKDEIGSSALRISGLWIIFAATFFIGISAGAVEVIVVARATDFGSRQVAGLLLATLSFSSVLAGYWYGKRHFTLLASSLWIRCLALLVVALVPFAFATNLPILVVAMFIAGLAIAPTSISGQVLTERILPTKLMNEGMSMVVTAMILGMAAGGWMSGVLIDKLGAYRAGILPTLVTFAALLIAMIGVQSLKPSLAKQ